MSENVGKREGQVLEQLNDLDKSIAVLSEVIGRVGERLKSVLIEPCPREEKRGPEQALAPLADTLRGYSKLINLQAERLEYLLDRLQL